MAVSLVCALVRNSKTDFLSRWFYSDVETRVLLSTKALISQCRCSIICAVVVCPPKPSPQSFSLHCTHNPEHFRQILKLHHLRDFHLSAHVRNKTNLLPKCAMSISLQRLRSDCLALMRHKMRKTASKQFIFMHFLLMPRSR